MKLIIGIDPGAKGAAVFLDERGEIYGWFHSENWHDDFRREMTRSVGHATMTVYIEKAQAMPGQGVAGMFRYGQGYGEILGALAALGVPVIQVPPRTWQKVAYQGIGGEGKARSFEACRRLFPHVNLVPGKCRKPHDGLADALLIAYYGRSKK